MTTARLDTRFAELARDGRAGFVSYIMAGDPDAATTLATLKGLPSAGADVIELGFPFSDPMADGPSIQRAALRALQAGMTLAGTLDLVRRFREGDDATPIVLMGYLNPILTYGIEPFAADAAKAGVDGIIVVDCPPEEAGPLADALDANRLSLIRLATPTTDAARLPAVLHGAGGFLYYVSVAGITGMQQAASGSIAQAVAKLKANTDLPIAVGFGVRTPDQAAEVARVADGVVVGSAIVDVIAAAAERGTDPAPDVARLVKDLSGAVRAARKEMAA